MARKRILSGMRPTGNLHLGNFVGVLANWVKLQEEYQCFFEVADWHALTTGYEDTTGLVDDGIEVVIDWLAAGIDPEKSVVFVQSEVKEHAELHLLFSMMITMARLERNPMLKEQVRDLEATVKATPCDVVVIGTPIDLRKLIEFDKPAVRVTYDLAERGAPDLKTVLAPFMK